jgi:hypothetical protein
MYDIACKLRKPLEVFIYGIYIKYVICIFILKQVFSLKNQFPVLKDTGSKYAITVFHAYGHKFECQVEYNPHLISGFGKTDGEGMERFWSYLAGYVKSTRQMTTVNRQLSLTDAVRYYTESKMENIGNVMLKYI